jgi:hypothetical protein
VIAARHRGRRAWLLALAAVPALAGCGATHAAHLSPAARHARQEGARVLTRGSAALDAVHSLRLTTTLVATSGKTTRAVADIALPGRLEVTLNSGSEHSQVRLISGFAYLHANAAYWRTAGAVAAAARLLTPHWYRVPDSSLSNSASLLALTRSATLARCTLGQPGSDAVVSHRDGHSTVVVRHTGATTDRITLASATPTLPASDVRTGPNVADPACGVSDQSAPIRGGTTTFARYNLPVTVSAPARFESESKMNSLLSAIS